jgi:hypothetical protein
MGSGPIVFWGNVGSQISGLGFDDSIDTTEVGP